MTKTQLQTHRRALEEKSETLKESRLSLRSRLEDISRQLEEVETLEFAVNLVLRDLPAETAD